MSVKIRLKRTGKRNAPHHRICVFDSRTRRDGRAIEVLGHYSPLDGDDKIVVNEERLKHWVGKGAQMSATVQSLVRRLKGADKLRQGEEQRKAERAKKKAQARAKAAEEKKAEAPAAEPAASESAPEQKSDASSAGPAG